MAITEGSPIARFTPQVTNQYIPVPFNEFYQLGLQYEKQRQDLLSSASSSANSLLGIKALDYVSTSTGRQYKVQDRDYLNKMTNELQNDIRDKSNEFVSGKIDMNEFRNYVRDKSQQINVFKNTVGVKLEEQYNQEQSRQKAFQELKDTNIRQDRFLEFDNSARGYGIKGGLFGGGILAPSSIGEAKDIYKELDDRAKDIPMMITSANPGSIKFNGMGIEERREIQKSNTFKLKDTFNAYWNTDLSKTIAGSIQDDVERIKEEARFSGSKPTYVIGNKKYTEAEYKDVRMKYEMQNYQTYFYNKAAQNDRTGSFNFSFLPEYIAKGKEEEQNSGMINTVGYGIPEASPFQVNKDNTDDSTSGRVRDFVQGVGKSVGVDKQLQNEGYTVSTPPLSPGSTGIKTKYYKDGKEISESDYLNRRNNILQGIKEVGDSPYKNQVQHLANSLDLTKYGYHDNREVENQLKKILSKPLLFTEAPINIQPEMGEVVRKQLRADLDKRPFDFTIDGKKYENTSFSKLLDDLGIDDINEVLPKMNIEPSGVYLATMKRNAEGGSIGGYITIPGVDKIISFKAPMDKNFTFATMGYQNLVSNSLWQGTDTYTKDKPKQEPAFNFNGKNIYQKWYTTTIPNKDYDPNRNDGGLVQPFNVLVHSTYYDAKTNSPVKGIGGTKSLEEVKADYIEVLNNSAKRILNSSKGYSKKDTGNFK